MRRLTTTLLLLALMLSLAAAAFANDYDHEECDERPIVKQCAAPCAPCPDCACGDCVCDPGTVCPPTAPASPCDQLRKLCPDRYKQWTVVDPEGTWLKCRARGCVLTEALP